MKPEVYRAVRDRCNEKLRLLYLVTACPIEGPAKATFGDVDMFVAWARAEIFPSLETKTWAQTRPSSAPSPNAHLQDIFRLLGAVEMKFEHHNSASMAIPWPEDFPKSDTNSQDGNSAEDQKPQFVQVDVHICSTIERLQWMLFKHAHGDLWSILGAMIRPFGLTVDEVGLFIRIPEIEELNKKEAKVLLSLDPAEVLSFLGLKNDDKKWEEPFASDEDVFEYATTCRLFFVKPEKPDDDDDAAAAPDATNTGGEIEADKRRLKSNDRRRMTYRPLFRKWIEEYLPARRAAGRLPSLAPPTRAEVQQQAFDYFPGVEAVCLARLREWHVKRQRETLWKEVIKSAVPTDMDAHQRGCCTSALKKIIMGGDETFDGITAPATLRGADGLFDVDAVRAWVEQNWQRVFVVAWDIYKQRTAEKMERKVAGSKRTASGSERPVGGNDERLAAEAAKEATSV
jgi:hypothetical protein